MLYENGVKEIVVNSIFVHKLQINPLKNNEKKSLIFNKLSKVFRK